MDPIPISREQMFLDALKKEAVEKTFRQDYVDYPLIVFVGGLRFIVTVEGKADLVLE